MSLYCNQAIESYIEEVYSYSDKGYNEMISQVNNSDEKYNDTIIQFDLEKKYTDSTNPFNYNINN